MTPQNGRASLREVYAIAQRIEAKIETLDEKYEARFDSVERWKAYLTGALAVSTFGLSTALIFVRF